MSQTLSNGTSLVSASDELKQEFSKVKMYLPSGWINKYMDRFCSEWKGKDYDRLKTWLYNCQRENPTAPSLSILANIEILIKENCWDENHKNL